MFEAVTPITPLAPHTCVLHCVDKRFAFRLVALCPRLQSWLSGAGDVGGRSPDRVSPSVARPFACFGASVGGFCAVIEAECAVAGVAAEGEEVELAAVGVLAVGADGFEVFGVEHGEGLVWCWLSHSGQELAAVIFVR